jgi:GT2 family glycosyltransferase
MPQACIAVVILNTNRRQDTLECLASLDKATYPNRKIIVLDNASTDGSVEAVRSQFPASEIIQLTSNLGYAGNNNVGIEAALKAGADWVLVLNEDTTLAPDCLEKMAQVGESDPRIGIVGPMVYHHNEPDIIQSGGGRMDRSWKAWHIAQNEFDKGQFDRPQQVDWISGCAILVRRAVIEQVGPLDARFFYYWEETEWCLRARENGWRIMLAPRAHLWHKGVQRDYRPSPSVTYYSTRNRLLMMSKHRAPLFAWASTWTEILRTLVSWTIKPKWKSKREHRDIMWRAVMDFFNNRWGRMPS